MTHSQQLLPKDFVNIFYGELLMEFIINRGGGIKLDKIYSIMQHTRGSSACAISYSRIHNGALSGKLYNFILCVTCSTETRYEESMIMIRR
jgi:hypothetical protein